MKLAKIKKYIFYLSALMPFIMILLYAVFYSFNNQLLDMTNFEYSYILMTSFLQITDSFTPQFVDVGEILFNLFNIDGLWGECLVGFFNYFVAVVIFNVLINIILFFVYIFESWVNKLEKDF